MKQKTYDFLIVGQGLAGSILAHTLIQEGYTLKIIDHEHRGSSSIVSAGIINPFTGPRLKLTDNFFEKFLKAKNFYQAIEKKLNTRLFHPIIQHRFLSSSEQYDYYLKRQLQFPQSFQFHTKDKIYIHDTASVNVRNFLKLSKNYFKKNSDFESAQFDYTQLQFKKNNLIYKNSSFYQLIFCEGYQNIYNPFFQHDLFQLSKGSIMNVEIQGLEKSFYNWGHWLVPNFNIDQHFYLGASYHWGIQYQANTEKEYALFTSKAPLPISKKVFTLKNHYTGIRPTTVNRQVLIQTSPQDSRLWLFNGFGSKGCLEIPHHAHSFINSLNKTRRS
ncbi:hypothetical protein MRY82_05390 [bacterium]|nr:hypothetical protein [bacterium]